jgi:two-component system, NtrC family, sensor kinase
MRVKPRRDAIGLKLYTKVVIALWAVFAVYGLIDYTIQRQVILPSFESLEAESARTDMERVTRALDRELTQLMTFSADWGNWIDTYEFMVDHGRDFIDTNMNPSFLNSSGIELVAFLDRKGRYTWRQGYEAGVHEPLHYAFLDDDTLEPQHPFLPSIAQGIRDQGIVLTEHGPMLLTLAPILDGNGNGPHRGAVLMGRLLTAKRIAQLAEQAQVRLTVKVLGPLSRQQAIGPDAPVTTRIVRRADTNEVYRQVTDVYGRHALMLRIDVPRSITAKGLAATRFALWSLLIVGVIVLLVLMLAIRYMILGPVSRMTRHAVRIAEHDDLTVRLALDRRDELGILAREFDRMVDKLEDARRRLVDHSFEAGAAQIASGVLHNVGNAMTPLGVTVASLQKRLREAPADDVALVLSELDKTGDSVERRADLEEFLRLTGRELANAVTQARGESDTVARQAEVIQQVLAQQLRSSHAAPVIEAVRLPDLVERAVEMVPIALRPFLSIHVDPALRSLRSVHVARITLQQVFQNLIQNAAESMRDAGRTRGNLYVSGGVVSGPDGEKLQVRFTDDGVGVAPEHLPRIFERGFSTKSRESNSGIGLHWCANAMHALGGSLRAENPEPGRGASFLVLFPLAEQGTGAARAA